MGLCAATAGGTAMHGAACGAELSRDDVVEDGFEVVEENGVGGAFEHEGKTPIGVYARGAGYVCGVYGDVGEEEGNGHEHAPQHDAEATIDADQTP